MICFLVRCWNPFPAISYEAYLSPEQCFVSAGQAFGWSVGRRMVIWRTLVVIPKDLSQTGACRRCTESLNTSRFKSIYPLTLTFCDKVKHIQLFFSYKSEFAIKGFFIQTQDGPFHLAPGSLILRASWGSLSRYKLICHVLHSKPKKETVKSKFHFQ